MGGGGGGGWEGELTKRTEFAAIETSPLNVNVVGAVHGSADGVACEVVREMFRDFIIHAALAKLLRGAIFQFAGLTSVQLQVDVLYCASKGQRHDQSCMRTMLTIGTPVAMRNSPLDVQTGTS